MSRFHILIINDSTNTKQCSSTPIAPPTYPMPIAMLTEEELCDLQIRLLEAGQELSKEDMLVVEEMTAKCVETDMLAMFWQLRRYSSHARLP